MSRMNINATYPSAEDSGSLSRKDRNLEEIVVPFCRAVKEQEGISLMQQKDNVPPLARSQSESPLSSHHSLWGQILLRLSFDQTCELGQGASYTSSALWSRGQK